MAVRVDSDGRRSVAAEVRVQGSAEQVWAAIATPAGLSAWFVPTDFELGADGAPTRTVSHFGPGMDAAAAVTSWEPPHRFAAISDDFAAGGPPAVTEWTVEPRGGSECIVRVQHSLDADADEWDGVLEAVEAGWPAFFRILQLYCRHFLGQPAALLALSAATDDLADGWARFAAQLGLSGASVGQRCSAPRGTPEFSGIIEAVPSNSEAIVRLDAPGPGAAHVLALEIGGRRLLSARLYLYGPDAAARAAALEPQWQAWMRGVEATLG